MSTIFRTLVAVNCCGHFSIGFSTFFSVFSSYPHFPLFAQFLVHNSLKICSVYNFYPLLYTSIYKVMSDTDSLSPRVWHGAAQTWRSVT